MQADVSVEAVLHAVEVVEVVQKAEQTADVVVDLLRLDVATPILKAGQTVAFQHDQVAHFASFGSSVVLPPSFHQQAQILAE
jgi:hypothetical protein